MSITVDTATTPLLTPAGETSSHSPTRLGDAARLLGRMQSSRMLSEQSLRVRLTAAQQIEEKRLKLIHSKRVLILDLFWNTVLVLSAIIVIMLSKSETPEVPLRLWIVGYGVQCVIHMFCVFVGYRRRELVMPGFFGIIGAGMWEGVSILRSNLIVASEEVEVDVDVEVDPELGPIMDTVGLCFSILRFANTMYIFIWWVIGLCWVEPFDEMLEAPKLFCVAIVTGISIFFFLPTMIGTLFTRPNEEGPSEDIIEMLSRYNFRRLDETEKPIGDIQESYIGVMVECDTDTPTEHPLSADDAACIICLCEYENGSELYVLPCHHHFDRACINKWLLVTSSCPLCKYDIPRNVNQSSDVV